jgi:hypothetical protein
VAGHADGLCLRIRRLGVRIPSGALSSTKFDDVRESCLHYDVLTVGSSIDCRVYDSRELSANGTDIPTTDGSGAGVVTSLSQVGAKSES